MKNVMLALALACLIIAALPATAGTIYDDGPINGTIDAWTINFGFTVADTFTVSSGTSKIDSLTFGAWLFPGDRAGRLRRLPPRVAEIVARTCAAAAGLCLFCRSIRPDIALTREMLGG